jgi:hypothetical protein
MMTETNSESANVEIYRKIREFNVHYDPTKKNNLVTNKSIDDNCSSNGLVGVVASGQCAIGYVSGESLKRAASKAYNMICDRYYTEQNKIIPDEIVFCLSEFQPNNKYYFTGSREIYSPSHREIVHDYETGEDRIIVYEYKNIIKHIN